jgi:hypothetical protein
MATNKALAEQQGQADATEGAVGNLSNTTTELTKRQKEFVEALQAGTATSSLIGLYEQIEALETAAENLGIQFESMSSKILGSEAGEYEQRLAMAQEFENTRFAIFQKYSNAREKQIELSLQRQMKLEGKHINELMTASQARFFQLQGEDEARQQIIKDRINFEKKSELEKTQFGLEQGAKFFQGLSAYNKKFFAAYKAFAIAQAIINTYQGATKALATYPPPFNFIAAAATVASGLAQVATIRAQTAQRGGTLIGGQPAVIGEDGPELIVPKQPSTVIPREVADAVEGLGGNKQQPVQVNFNITTTDAKGFDSLLVERRSTIVGIINQAMNTRGKTGVTV